MLSATQDTQRHMDHAAAQQLAPEPSDGVMGLNRSLYLQGKTKFLPTITPGQGELTVNRVNWSLLSIRPIIWDLQGEI